MSTNGLMIRNKMGGQTMRLKKMTMGPSLPKFKLRMTFMRQKEI